MGKSICGRVARCIASRNNKSSVTKVNQMIRVNFNPTERQLRQFGVAALFMLPLFAWLLRGWPGPATWQGGDTALVGGFASAGVVLATLGVVYPRALRFVYLGLTLVVFPIGLVVSELILLSVFALVFTPVALVFRLIGRDALDRTIRRDSESYWRPKQSTSDPRDYFRQS